MAEGSVVELLFATRVPFGFSMKISISTFGTGHCTDHVKLCVAARLEALMVIVKTLHAALFGPQTGGGRTPVGFWRQRAICVGEGCDY